MFYWLEKKSLPTGKMFYFLDTPVEVICFSDEGFGIIYRISSDANETKQLSNDAKRLVIIPLR